MKITRTLSTALIIIGGSISPGLYADAVTPDEPKAYESLSIEIEIRGTGKILEPHYLEIDGDTILIGYQSRPVGFIPPDVSWLSATIPGLAPGTYSVKTAYLPDLADDVIEINNTTLSFTVAEAPATQRAYAFFHPWIEHYFVTASDEEADSLFGQDGWEIVDFGFNVWHADDPAPASAVPVCRFYSELVNSHFYTGSAEECTLLQEEDHGWTYEGIAFQALLPTDGACPAGTASVWRLYNDRAEQRDSNHRFVASSETYRSMISTGWVGEGVAFCSPPASVL